MSPRRACGAVVLVVALLVGVVGTAGVVRPEPAAAQLSDDDSLVTDLFKQLAEGAAGEVGGDLAGWALGALGLGGDDFSAATVSELKDIDTQLKAIDSELEDIAGEIAEQGCDDQIGKAADAVNAIDTAHTRYLPFVTAAAENPSAMVDTAGMAKWAYDVLNAQDGIVMAMDAALNKIGEVMIAAGGEGILHSCLVSSIVTPPTAGTLGDAVYYGYDGSERSSALQVNDFMGYYYGYQAMGLMMLQEAYHLQAQQAAGVTGLTPDQVGQLCIDYKQYPTEVETACLSATINTNAVYENLAAQFELAGLPYTDDDVIIQADGKTSKLYVRSLEAFTAAAGSKCPTPLTSTQPCGVTASYPSQASTPMKVIYPVPPDPVPDPGVGEYYDSWQAATASDLTELVASRGSETPAAYMDKAGFANAEKKIILTADTVPFTVENGNGLGTKGTLVCFLDTGLTTGVVCSNDQVNKVLLTTGLTCETSLEPLPLPTWHTPSSLMSGPFGRFYSTQLRNSNPTQCTGPYRFNPPPGWLAPGNQQQFRWPSIDISTLTCTGTHSATNVGGTPTRCGNDFDDMFQTLVTRPATCGGTTIGQCTSDGYYILESDGDVHSYGAVHPLDGVKGDLLAGESAIAIAARRGGLSFWVLTDQGRILGRGGQTAMAGIQPQGPVVAHVDLAQLTEPGERLSTLAVTPDGRGLWVFSTAGRILSLGSATAAQLLTGADDVLALDLDGPIVHSFPAPDGAGVYMVGGDGGVFATGTAQFAGSVRGALTALHGPPGLPAQPVVGAVADPDGYGYWLVGADGGVFSFAADFHGSLPAIVPFHDLVAPVNGMAPYGDGYVLIAGDGGLFNLSDVPFAGSAHGHTDSPVVGVATGT